MTFDPYHIWLGISPDQQPPNHYELLGIRLFESNTDAIANAAEQRMAFVRQFQLGQRSEESQRILNELSAARNTLLNDQHRAAYDNELRSRDASEPSSENQPSAADSDVLMDVPTVEPLKSFTKRQTRFRSTQIIAGVAAVVAIGVIFWAIQFSPNENSSAQDEPPPPKKPQPKKTPKKTEKEITKPPEKIARVEVKTPGVFSPFKVGAIVCSNRDYKWTKVGGFDGFRYLCNASVHQATTTFDVTRDGTIYLAVTERGFSQNIAGLWRPKDLEAKGWTRVEEIESYEGAPTKWFVYKRDCRAGESFSIRTEKYYAPVILLPKEAG